MPTMPTLTRLANSRAAWPLRVKIATPLPYWCLLGKRERGFKIGRADDLQHGAENLFLVAFHVGGDMVEQRRAEEIAFLMPLHFEATAIDHQFGAFVDCGLDPAFDFGLVLGGDHRAIMRFFVGRNTHAQRFDCRDQLCLQPLGRVITHWHHHRQRHAALARRAVRLHRTDR